MKRIRSILKFALLVACVIAALLAVALLKLRSQSFNDVYSFYLIGMRAETSLFEMRANVFVSQGMFYADWTREHSSVEDAANLAGNWRSIFGTGNVNDVDDKLMADIAQAEANGSWLNRHRFVSRLRAPADTEIPGDRQTTSLAAPIWSAIVVSGVPPILWLTWLGARLSRRMRNRKNPGSSDDFNKRKHSFRTYMLMTARTLYVAGTTATTVSLILLIVFAIHGHSRAGMVESTFSSPAKIAPGHEIKVKDVTASWGAGSVWMTETTSFENPTTLFPVGWKLDTIYLDEELASQIPISPGPRFPNWHGFYASLDRGSPGDPSSSIEAGAPIWFVVLMLAVLPASWLTSKIARLVRSRRDARRRAAGRCLACGYDLRATADQCPECGRLVLK